MTSSLVGSEMCIRDSERLEHKSEQEGLGMGRTLGNTFPSLTESGIKPVSYTHLTLPTICSV
eukprot:5532836-Prorocentrum_lima.AAC.1